MTRTLGGDHADIHERGRSDEAKADVEAVREEERVTLLQVGLDGGRVERGLNRVRGENHDEVGLSRRGRRINNAKSSLFGLCTRLGTFSKTHAHIDTGIAQRHGMGVTLAAEADDGHHSVLDDRKVGALFIEQLSHGVPPASWVWSG